MRTLDHITAISPLSSHRVKLSAGSTYNRRARSMRFQTTGGNETAQVGGVRLIRAGG